MSLHAKLLCELANVIENAWAASIANNANDANNAKQEAAVCAGRSAPLEQTSLHETSLEAGAKERADHLVNHIV